MTNPIKNIYRFNKEAGLLDKGYDDCKEIAYSIEEMLEAFPEYNLQKLATKINSPEDTPKMISRHIATIVNTPYKEEINISDVDRFDKHLDAIVFNFGSLFKLGLTPQQAMKGLSVVMQANMQKLHAGQDSEGKQQKPVNFVGPEEQLQKILDERSENDV